MSDSPWSNNPFAPKIPYDVYFGEKTSLAGAIVGGMFYGGLVVLFFQCMAALFSPINRRRQGGVKRGLVIYTVAMFSFATVYTGLNTDIQSVSLIDNREFPGIGDTIPPGPLGYQMYIYSKPITIIPNLMFLLNNWMADGLLLYRCYIIYSKNSWIVAFPCLAYLASVAMGTTFIYQTSQPNSSVWNTVAIDFGLPYFSISVGLNILLTLMIATYLTLHGRNVCLARGAPSGTTGLYKTVITMLVESSALYAVSSLLFIGTWGARSHAADIFLSILGEVQVIAPLLIIRRVANHSALTSDSLATGQVSSLRFGGQEEIVHDSSGSLPAGYSMGEVYKYGKSPNEPAVGVDVVLDFHPDNEV